MRKTLSRLTALGLLAIVGSSAHAVVLISNMPGNDGTQTALINALRQKAMSFTTSAGTPFILSSATLRLNANVNAAPILNLHADTGANLPGTMLTTFTNPGSFTTGFQNYTFTTGFALSSSTKYWLVLSQPAGTTPFDWKASSPAVTPTGTFTHSGSLFTTNGGTTWTTSATLTTYQLEGSPVPEPATMAALGLGALALLRRRRKA
jgi:hypothetical protein